MESLDNNILIYCLVDPSNNHPFYVGATYLSLEKRLYQHIYDAKNCVAPTVDKKIWRRYTFDHKDVQKMLAAVAKQVMKMCLLPPCHCCRFAPVN